MKLRFRNIVFLLLLGILVSSCDDDTIEVLPEDAPYTLEYGKLPQPEIPADNPLTVQGVKLGRMLFYEKMLSRDNSISCASCHNQKAAFSDTNRVSIGVGGSLGKRQAMAVFNTLWHNNEFFWDGRAHLLRDQSLKPIQDDLEMDETLDNVVLKLKGKKLYRDQFKVVFGDENITAERMSKAMEQFMNSIVSYQSKFDDFLVGKAELTPLEERGKFLFFTEYNPAFPNASGADCQHCHGGANFENDNYMNNGIDDDVSALDDGRKTATGLATDKAKFKVPSLRNVALTPPYMHDGRFKTLDEVINHYNLVRESQTLDPSFYQQLPGGLKLSDDDKKALVAFLHTLTDTHLISDPKYADPFE